MTPKHTTSSDSCHFYHRCLISANKRKAKAKMLLRFTSQKTERAVAGGRLTPKGPKIHGFGMINSIDHILKIIIEMRPNFISSKTMKNIACIDQNMNKTE
jgi:uncharacterized Fe-S cluster-containing MiaB family protein